MTDEVKTLKEWVDAPDISSFSAEPGCPRSPASRISAAPEGCTIRSGSYPAGDYFKPYVLQKQSRRIFPFLPGKMLCPDAKPNAAHKKLAQWEQEGKLLAVVTQNIDGLHQAAGSRNVYELHGSVHRNYCERCGKFYPLDHILHTTGVPRCAAAASSSRMWCFMRRRLNDKVIDGAVNAIAQADLLIVGGTSLNVWPAAGLINYFRGERIWC